jgi:hypothetical protein
MCFNFNSDIMKIEFKKFEMTNYWSMVFVFIIIKLCLHFFTNTKYELHRDELLYFNMGDHLSFGYASVPPLIGFFAFVVKLFFGYSVFGLRLLPAILGGATIIIIAKIVKELGGGIFALFIACLAFLLSTGFLLFDTLFTPNVVEQFLWLLITFYIIRMVSNFNQKLWICIGILVGLAFLNKYSVAFFVIGLVIALLTSPYRKLLSSRYFLYALLISFFIVLPNILWQYFHNFPFIHHMNELENTQFKNTSFTSFIVDVLSLNFASSVIWIFGLVSLIFFKQERKFRFLGVAFVLIILFFMFSKGKGYYILGIIPVLFAFGACALEKYLKGKFLFLNYVILFVTCTLSLVFLPFGLPILTLDKVTEYSRKVEPTIFCPFLRWEDGKVHEISQIYSDMTGWRELAYYVGKAYNQLSRDEKLRCTIFCEKNYGYAGAIHFYGKEYGLPNAITFLDSYTLWAPDTISKGAFIYINNNIGDIKYLFSDIVEIGCVNNPNFREKGLKVFLCTKPIIDVQEMYKQVALKEKNIYKRKF